MFVMHDKTIVVQMRAWLLVLAVLLGCSSTVYDDVFNGNIFRITGS